MMLEVVLFWIGAAVVIALGLALIAWLCYLVAVAWIAASNAWRRILKAKSLIYEYKKNRDKFLEWKEAVDDETDNN